MYPELGDMKEAHQPRIHGGVVVNLSMESPNGLRRVGQRSQAGSACQQLSATAMPV